MTPPRFHPLSDSEMTAVQREARDRIVSGPRGGMRGPFNALLRSPELADHVQKVGEHIRFRSSLPAKLNELAILVTARYWGAQYEWYAHRQLAEKAGLDPRIADAIAANEKPEAMDDREAAVYAFAHELHHSKSVSDAAFGAVVERFGEQGAIDLVGACGYYTLVSMVLNVDRYPLPEGVEPPLR